VAAHASKMPAAKKREKSGVSLAEVERQRGAATCRHFERLPVGHGPAARRLKNPLAIEAEFSTVIFTEKKINHVA